MEKNTQNSKNNICLLPSSILYEDNHLIAINKAPGQIVQGDKTGDIPLSELLKDYIKQRDNKPGKVFLGVPHRLDRPVSGVVLFAKTGKALGRVNELIRDRAFDKTYWAIVRQAPPLKEDHLKHWLRRNESQNKSYVCTENHIGALCAELSYKLLAKSDRYYLLEIKLYTGRHHQIRAQLASIGSPVKGDLKYGDTRSNPDGGICLHSKSLGLVHPIKKTLLHIEAPLPKDSLWQYFENLSLK
ncbi:MAG: RluA family pseudouridine synthase [Bacteroidales bacterium]